MTDTGTGDGNPTVRQGFAGEMILATGAAGSNGAEIVKRLAAGGARAMVRDHGRAGAVVSSPNVEVVEGGFDRPQTLSAALDGVERAFLLTPSSERAQAQQIAFVEAARRSGVAHVVKLSQFAAAADAPGRSSTTGTRATSARAPRLRWRGSYRC